MSFILLCRCFVIIVQNSVLNFCSNAFRGRSHWSLIIFVVDVIQSYIAIKNLKRGKTDLLFATSYERHPQYLIMVGFQEKNWFKLSLFLDFVSKWKKCLPEVEFFPWVIGLSFVLESQFFRRPVLKKERGLTAYSSKIRPPCVTSFRRWNFPLKSKKGRKEGRKEGRNEGWEPNFASNLTLTFWLLIQPYSSGLPNSFARISLSTFQSKYTKVLDLMIGVLFEVMRPGIPNVMGLTWYAIALPLSPMSSMFRHSSVYALYFQWVNQSIVTFQLARVRVLH